MISINFASRNYPLLHRIRTGLIVGCVVLTLLTGGTLWRAVSLRSSISLLEQELTDRQAALEKFRPLLAERAQLVKNLSAMSGITRSRQFSWTRLLSAIESVVPVGAALTTVDFNPESSELKMEGAARSPEALRTLVIALERSTRFSEPMLKRQTFEKGIISFNVAAYYRQESGPAMDYRGK